MHWALIQTSWPVNMSKEKCALMIFCKAPVPGQVKTRLIPELGPDGAAALFTKLAKGTIATARQSSIEDIYLYCSPDISHSFFASCVDEFRISLRQQQGGDLGERMAGAFGDVLAVYGSAVLIGCDCPDLASADLDAASAALGSGADVVLGPCEDGGYYLVGLQRTLPQLFEHMQWGSPEVLDKTRERITGSGLAVTELPLRWDVDRPIDLYRYLDGYDVNGRVRQLPQNG